MAFLDDDFLLATPAARLLYHEHAAGQPIIDYHCHLPPADVARDRRFANLAEIWLEDDHYKWRAMRANGIPERLITGDAEPYEKFMAWARTAPKTLRNPLYHWTHLELRRVFGINLLLDESTAPEIWARANERLASPEFSARGIMARFRVEVVCTTDAPHEPLDHHEAIARSGFATRVLPTYRPDLFIGLENRAVWNRVVDQLGEIAGTSVGTFDGFLRALETRHDFFHALGGRLSDHGMEKLPETYAEADEAAGIFDRARRGEPVDPAAAERFAGFMMVFWGRLDAAKGWTKQLHLGAQRDNSARQFAALGPNKGFDSIGDAPQARGLCRYLDRLDRDGRLPRTIVYNLNPRDNYVVATALGNFQDGSVPGKLQFGTGWWFLDQLEGMTWQINALSQLGLLSRFVGMLTDSRSFLSYPRHEYFRRLLCRILGEDVARGELPDDMALLGGMVEDIAYRNAKAYFGF